MCGRDESHNYHARTGYEVRQEWPSHEQHCSAAYNRDKQKKNKRAVFHVIANWYNRPKYYNKILRCVIVQILYGKRFAIQLADKSVDVQPLASRMVVQANIVSATRAIYNYFNMHSSEFLLHCEQWDKAWVSDSEMPRYRNQIYMRHFRNVYVRDDYESIVMSSCGQIAALGSYYHMKLLNLDVDDETFLM